MTSVLQRSLSSTANFNGEHRVLRKEFVKTRKRKVSGKETRDLKESWTKDLVIDALQTKAAWEVFNVYF